MKGKTNWMVDLKIWRVMRENWGWEKKYGKKKKKKRPSVLNRKSVYHASCLGIEGLSRLFECRPGNHYSTTKCYHTCQPNCMRTTLALTSVMHVSSIFFINIYVFNMMRFPLTQLDYNEKTMTKIWKKLLSGLRIFVFKNYF